jgi:recombination endonuclease VII
MKMKDRAAQARDAGQKTFETPDKPCRRCGGTVRLTRTTHAGRCVRCKANCRRQWGKKVKGGARVRARRYRMWNDSGGAFTQSDYDSMLESQGHVCRLCKLPFDVKRPPVVDHEHINPDGSGPVRGIVHNTCNAGIGMLGDNAQSTLQATEYLGVAVTVWDDNGVSDYNRIADVLL